MMNKKYNLLKSLSFILASFLISCGIFTDIGGNTQSTTQVVASPFISELYGTSSKTLSLNVSDIDHIAWMSLDQSGDYGYFKVESYTYAGKTTTNSSGTSSAVFKNISLSASTSSSTSSKTLKIVMSYTPSTAITADNKPHEATLNIAYDLPNTGAMTVTLEGYTQGIAESKCAGAASATTVYTYQLSADMDLYVCDSGAITGSLITYSPSTNYTKIDHTQITDDFIFYQVDDGTLCIVGPDNAAGITESIPTFELPVPPVEGLPESLTTLPVSLNTALLAECTIDGSSVLCDNNIVLNIVSGAVPLTLTVTNGTIDPSTQTSDCSSFGIDYPTGDGILSTTSGDTLNLVAWGVIGSNSLIDSYHIDGALVVVKIPLTAK